MLFTSTRAPKQQHQSKLLIKSAGFTTGGVGLGSGLLRLCYRVKLDTQCFKLVKTDITFLSFFLRRFRQRTSLRRRWKDFISWDSQSSKKRVLRQMTHVYLRLEDEGRRSEALAADQYDSFLTNKKRLFYFQFWFKFMNSRREYRMRIAAMRQSLDSHPITRRALYYIFRPYLFLAFQSFVLNLLALDITCDEIELADDFQRHHKRMKGFEVWRRRHKQLHSMRSFRDSLHMKRLHLANDHISADHVHIFSRCLPKLAEHQVLRRALGRLKRNASFPFLFFCRSDALVNAALHSGVLASITSRLLSIECPETSPKVAPQTCHNLTRTLPHTCHNLT